MRQNPVSFLFPFSILPSLPSLLLSATTLLHFILYAPHRYPIASRPPGLCLIFLMTENRIGASKDLMRVRELFEKVLKYDVFVKVDPTAEQIKSIISKLKAARNKFYDR